MLCSNSTEMLLSFQKHTPKKSPNRGNEKQLLTPFLYAVFILQKEAHSQEKNKTKQKLDDVFTEKLGDVVLKSQEKQRNLMIYTILCLEHTFKIDGKLVMSDCFFESRRQCCQFLVTVSNNQCNRILLSLQKMCQNLANSAF